MKAIKILFFSLVAVATILSSCKKDKKIETTPTVVTNVPTNVTTTTASVSGKITDNGNATITEAGFVYSNVVAEPTTADNKVQVTNFDTFTAELTGLASGKTYRVRTYAINSKGIGYGELRTFETGNQAPVVTTLLVSGELSVGKTVTAAYTYTDAENDSESGTIYQWYIATTATGTGETAIAGATAKTFVIQDAQQDKFLRFSVTPKAAIGTVIGTEVKSPWSTSAVGAETVTFMYNGAQVTYGTITSTKTGKKWLDRNLGASRVATSITDYQAFGDLFQWGRLADGHQLVTRTGLADANALGVNGITSVTAPYQTSAGDVPGTNKFIISPPGFRDWRTTQNDDLWQKLSGINNPCPSGWRIATQEEWIAEDLITPDDAFTRLKLTRSGRRDESNGSFVFSGTLGFYWTSTPHVAERRAFHVTVGSSSVSVDEWTSNPRATPAACRCVKN